MNNVSDIGLSFQLRKSIQKWNRIED